MKKSKATYITTPLDTKAQEIWNNSIDEAIEKNKDPKAAIQQIADDIERAVKADKDMLKANTASSKFSLKHAWLRLKGSSGKAAPTLIRLQNIEFLDDF